VRKGEHGITVVYADRFIPDDEKKRARETGEEAQAIPFLKCFTMFNQAQCEGLPEDLAVVAPPPAPGLIEPEVEALIKATGIDFRIGGTAGPSTSLRMTMCRYPRPKLISRRSTCTGRRSMNLGTQVEYPIG